MGIGRYGLNCAGLSGLGALLAIASCSATEFDGAEDIGTAESHYSAAGGRPSKILFAGTGGSTGHSNPCSGLCSNPTVFSWSSGNYISGSLGTGIICRETRHPIVGGTCYNFAAGRRLWVNAVQVQCNSGNWSSVPAPRAGGYCLQANAGNYPWAGFALW